MSANILSMMNLNDPLPGYNRDQNVNPDDQRFRDDNASNDTLTWPKADDRIGTWYDDDSEEDQEDEG